MALVVKPIRPRRVSGTVPGPGPGPDPDPEPFSPLSIDWHTAFWGDDPDWSDPGDGNRVSQWDDASGNGRHATQSGTDRPTFVEAASDFNDRGTVEFLDGDSLATASFAADLTNPAEYFVVMRLYPSASTGRNYFAFDSLQSANRHVVLMNSSDEWAMPGGITHAPANSDERDGAWAWRFVFDDASSAMVQGGNVRDTGDATGFHSTGLRIGQRWDAGFQTWWHGKIAFFGVKDGLLTAQERSDLEAWAADHYGLDS